MEKKTTNTTMTEIADVLLDQGSHHRNTIDDAHFSGVDSGYRTKQDIMTARHKENLPFQEWTAKYHQ